MRIERDAATSHAAERWVGEMNGLEREGEAGAHPALSLRKNQE
jgi:hypothetical protein